MGTAGIMKRKMKMKKLMIMLAAVAIGFSAQAAVAITWQTGTGIKDANGNPFTTANTAYTASIAFFTDAAAKTPITFTPGGTISTKSYVTKGGKGFGDSTGATFDAGTYYTVITISDGNKEWKSDVGSFTIAPGATSASTINFTSGLNMGGSSLINSNAYAPIVPEPTSGILMLVGLGALALRRRRA